jgi:1,4-alpha-glucan branching enzyme
MSLIPVNFEYLTGLRRPFVVGARLTGSWNAQGLASQQWSSTTMQPFTAEDGCPAFRATVQLDDSQIGQTFRWGVWVDTAERADVWGIPTEIKDRNSPERTRSFTLGAAGQTERYYLTHCRRLGANKLYTNGQSPAIRFAVWAPNARNVELVRGSVDGESSEGRRAVYIADTLRGGYISTRAADLAGIPMQRDDDGIWTTEPGHPDLADFDTLEHTLYMFRITKDDDRVAYRTDLYSRCQVGSGATNPEAANANWSGLCRDLDGTVSCSVVINPERVTTQFQERDAAGRPVWPQTQWLAEDDFWSGEFDPNRPLPSRIEDLVIYELHTGALGFGTARPGRLEDAIDLLDYLVDLGVNAVELLPLSEFGGGGENWGYSTSHFCAVEYSEGGRDQYKFFVKQAHMRGLAVIMDVVYNHYAREAERAEWLYDTNAHERNCYYWYEGRPGDYPAYEEAAARGARDTSPGHGGYLDNNSSGYAPAYYEEMVRKLFISSAVALVHEFHADGLRVDQTTSIHSYNKLHANGQAPEPNDANIYGAKFLRDLGRTLRMIKPDVILMAEDHSDFSEVTRPVEDGGMGFDARWYADFYHHLAGDTDKGSDYAKLIWRASQNFGQPVQPLQMNYFAGALHASGTQRIVYNESHDEAGNS